ncbi:M14 family metallopeptidase [Roseimaritima ulvae]|uniref:Succinylglutamate desuccinylase / Aspartoacylase family protein n=1 Tax=Roseimaritima ulvae TaxID=980254 RepID=A0A5B9R883_9BACT|nr:M14 family metallopeptidase [Roseimaritima ulvae]QEG42783.1 Succinylglutamate desuccinylase / Aspartoacylase family protein [Roseimaritima ulvae]
MDFATADYASCRHAFRQLADRYGAHQEAWPIDEAADLTIDAAVWGPENARHTMIISSGLHGAEGPFGSHIQQRWMQTALEQRPQTTRLILLHALNPFGFAHRRRFDQDNLDLNRAFFDAPQRPDTAELYGRLDPLLNPPGPPRRDGFLLRALAVVARHGLRKLGQAIVAGQYTHPRGLFYGGQQKSALQEVLETRLLPRLQSSAATDHFDLHTGLGKFCQLRLLMLPGVASEAVHAAVKLYGDQVMPPQTDVGYQARGTLGGWLQQRLGASDGRYRYYCVEVGTYSVLKVLSALRDENRAWFACGSGAPAHERAAEALIERFQPADARWQTQATEQVMAVLNACK